MSILTLLGIVYIIKKHRNCIHPILYPEKNRHDTVNKIQVIKHAHSRSFCIVSTFYLEILVYYIQRRFKVFTRNFVKYNQAKQPACCPTTRGRIKKWAKDYDLWDFNRKIAC